LGLRKSGLADISIAPLLDQKLPMFFRLVTNQPRVTKNDLDITVKEIEAYLVDGGIDVDGLLERVEKLLKNRRSVYEHTAKNL